MVRFIGSGVLACCTLAAVLCGSASGDEIAGFYTGKRLTVVVGSEAGSGYDAYARLLARNIIRFIPGNPEAIVQNRPGAGSITAINAVYNTMAQDGTVLLSLNRTAPFTQILGHSGAQFDPVRLNWLGSLYEEIGLLVVAKQANTPTLADARRKAVIIGATSPGTDSVIFPALLNNTIGTRFQLVQGYGGMDPIYLAFARGEVEGQESSLESLRRKIPNWRSEADLLVQFGLRKHRDLPDVPLVFDSIDKDWINPGLTVEEANAFWRFILSQTMIGRPFAVGPNVPKERVQVLRTAFESTVRDSVFLEQAAKSQLDINPISGAEIDALIVQAASLPRETIERLKNEINYKGANVTAPKQP
jgi:tripartite-type tricarboxylate transporter receptor subunit TctC